MRLKKLSLFVILIAGLATLSGCNWKADNKSDGLGLLNTEVFYQHGEQLPEGAVLEVRLEDISNKGREAKQIATVSRGINSAPPYLMQIAFPKQLIKVKSQYNLAASIRIDGELYYASTEQVNPFAVGTIMPIEIEVEQVDESRS